ncbi:hypothetical protein E3N88_39536 [Mikania micrantha]|uniref:Ubiquitin-like domain-containing protein n=1 Tax=Mikania micrantha TaxID=192012 RepID=A0A5N6LX18_9ASTR|nr:hypothetical protein E3N88_39536 [Mikania micrantha]
MPSIGHENRNPRILIHNALIFRGLSYSYHKLPKSLLKLSVLKLDGSSFGIEVPVSATVAELKLALEEFFHLLPKDERCTISWSHVWGHFCLCYEGEKLLDDKAYIKRLGIKDGDQIKFVRHVAINYRPGKQQIKNQSDEPKRHSLSRPHRDGESGDAINRDSAKLQETNIFECQCEEEESEFMPGSKLTNFLRGWFSYRKFRNSMV